MLTLTVVTLDINEIILVSKEYIDLEVTYLSSTPRYKHTLFGVEGKFTSTKHAPQMVLLMSDNVPGSVRQ